MRQGRIHFCYTSLIRQSGLELLIELDMTSGKGLEIYNVSIFAFSKRWVMMDG
ncbi:hypothetical protein ABGV42_13105 [Paenibacillus pabuli]|uniref:hypothetical protein n=1 Tax=Paenibacillus pabuli TaxID=1472 RepID=UPI003242797F